MFKKLTLWALSLCSFTMYRSNAADEPSSIKAGFDKLVAFLKRENKETYTRLHKPKNAELKDDTETHSLQWGPIPGEVTAQFFKHSDNQTRLKYRRLNKKWNKTIQLHYESKSDSKQHPTDDYIDSPFYTSDTRTAAEYFIGAPEKIVFKDYNTEMLTSLMRSGALQYMGRFGLGMVVKNDAGMKLLAESLKNQQQVRLCQRHNLHDFDMPALIMSLAQNPHLTELNLQPNFLQKDDQDAVLNLINNNKKIKTLVLECNTYNPNNKKSSADLGMNYISRIVKNNLSIQTLIVHPHLEQKHVEAEEMMTLKHALENNTTLKKLYLPDQREEPQIPFHIRAQLQDPRISFDDPKKAV